MSPPPTAAVALAAATARLRAAGLAEPGLDARHLLAHALGIGAERLVLHLHDPLGPSAEARLAAAVAARLARQPVAQITGGRLFWGRRFAVTGDVLDPRPETETLIAAALAQPFARFLDLGTGSGAIAVTLLAERPAAQGLAVDLSEAALAVAARNAATFGVGGRLTLCRSDWCAAVTGRFDLIVSNPPYIAAAEMATLAPEVRDWEPHLALTDGADGLTPCRIIAAQAPAHLTPGGRLLIEIGPTQGAAARAILAAAGFADLHLWPDMDGRDRILGARWPGADLPQGKISAGQG